MEIGQESLKALLSMYGYTVETTGTADRAIQVANELNPDLLIIDWNLGGQMNGLQLLLAIRSICSDIAAIMISGHLSQEIKREISEVPKCEFLEKPFALSDFQEAVVRLDGN